MPGRLLVTVDSLRRDHFDELPQTRAFFDEEHDRAFAVSTATPGSFPGILAGAYPTPGGLDDTPQFASELDCHTVGVSTNHLLSERYGYADAYDHFEAPEPSDSGVKDRVARAVPEGTLRRQVLSAGWNAYQRVTAPFRTVDRTFRPASDVIDALLSAVEGHDDWFGWIHLMEPHHPYEPSTLDVDRVTTQNATRRVLDGRGSTADEELVREAYRAELRELDAELARLWDALPADTGVVFTADHGELLGEAYDDHSWGHPGVMRPELLHVPFATRNLDAPTGEVYSLIDLGTTFLGEPFGAGETDREYAFATYGDQKAVIDADTMFDGERFYDLAGPSGPDRIRETEPDDAATLRREWEQFDPDVIRRTDEALREDLEDLGYV